MFSGQKTFKLVDYAAISIYVLIVDDSTSRQVSFRLEHVRDGQSV